MNSKTPENAAAVEPMVKPGLTFSEHKELTATDCESIAKLLTELAAEVREGNMDKFEIFWIDGGTEECDSKIAMWRETIIMRYLVRKEKVVA